MAWQIAGYNDSYECDRWAACAVVSHGDIMWAWSQIGKLIVWAACVQGKIGLVKCEACNFESTFFLIINYQIINKLK